LERVLTLKPNAALRSISRGGMGIATG
jgi:hypothetical protein